MKIAAWVAPEAPKATPGPGSAGIPWKPSRRPFPGGFGILGAKNSGFQASFLAWNEGIGLGGWEGSGGSGNGDRIPKGQNSQGGQQNSLATLDFGKSNSRGSPALPHPPIPEFLRRF